MSSVHRFACALSSLALFACGLAACGSVSTSASTSPAHVAGTVEGAPFTPAEALSTVADISSGGKTGSAGAIAIFSRAGLCADLTSGTNPSGPLQAIGVYVYVVDPATQTVSAPTQGGVFNLFQPTDGAPPDGPTATARYVAVDAAGSSTSHKCRVATSGTITLTKAGGGSFAGTGDITFDCGDHVTVEFDGTPCAAVAGVVADLGT